MAGTRVLPERDEGKNNSDTKENMNFAPTTNTNIVIELSSIIMLANTAAESGKFSKSTLFSTVCAHLWTARTPDGK